ncbi:MAG: UDP-glucose/GDP-mannose dehydrogenase family protein [Candidatus Omnitrophica bacterium]|nr:UDP-glucose/GDP-mannose dehydrogenase family protein [Candidatus Omnitrophota bacterium]MCM8809918.1 UDP-glucose/GDP-mannose dehydrogenase family protein [Candidatus Omnitrophota bacterium]MCM8811017.1 UDP-glucose/GDP-mannose dehydrogenase family protein [Candidatus Omnitrophota bacterium]
MRKIGIIGSGHVGLVTGACFAKLGNMVICCDNDIEKIKKLNCLQIPFYEPGLEEIVKECVEKKLLFFTESIYQVVKDTEIIFIAVGTPPTEEGKLDLSYVENVTVEIANSLTKIKNENLQKKIYRLIVEKSTVPVLTSEWVKKTLELLTPTGVEFDIAANPEFLREGNAVNDFFHPDRIVIGVETKRAKKIFQEIYKPIKCPKIFTDIRSAELIKHASNSFLALKISYINAIANICEKVGADIEVVAEGMGLDRRIGKDFLKAGIGYGGSCFPKDIAAFISLSEEIGYPFNLLKEVEKINQQQRLLVIKKAKELLWNLKEKNIGIFGLSFKPNTDDIREAPSIDIIKLMKKEGAILKCHDPKAIENMKKIFPDIFYSENPYEITKDSHLLIFLTEWNDYKKLDFKKIKDLMKMPYIIDGRNFLDYKILRKLGFVYRGIGRKNE